MTYRVMIDLNFADKSVAQPLVDLANKLSEGAVNVNESLENQEIGYVLFEEHNHTLPAKPCETISKVEVARAKVIR